MNEIQDALLTLLPAKRRTTPSGWISMNAVCCHHRGQNADARGRGGITVGATGSFTYNCFNCGFKAGWTPGHLMSRNTRQLFLWLGLGESEVGKLSLLAMKIRDDQPITKKALNFVLEPRSLPDQCQNIDTWIAQGCQDTELLAVISYLVDTRKMGWDWYPWHWSAAPGYRDRVILPFYQNGEIVGYTGRKIQDGNPKYLTDSQPGYVFNMDRQTSDRKYVIVVEGQFDAIAIDGVAVMHNNPSDTQVARINALGREVIVVPDRDKPGAEMLKTTLEQGWSASVPDLGPDIKDVADSVKKYGRLYTLSTILRYRVSNQIKIQLMKRQLEKDNNN